MTITKIPSTQNLTTCSVFNQPTLRGFDPDHDCPIIPEPTLQVIKEYNCKTIEDFLDSDDYHNYCDTFVPLMNARWPIDFYEPTQSELSV